MEFIAPFFLVPSSEKVDIFINNYSHQIGINIWFSSKLNFFSISDEMEYFGPGYLVPQAHFRIFQVSSPYILKLPRCIIYIRQIVGTKGIILSNILNNLNVSQNIFKKRPLAASKTDWDFLRPFKELFIIIVYVSYIHYRKSRCQKRVEIIRPV